jgi:hypothetical protein
MHKRHRAERLWFRFRLFEIAATAAGFTMKYMEDMEAASGSLMEKPMQDQPQNAQEAQGREALP